MKRQAGVVVASMVGAVLVPTIAHAQPIGYDAPGGTAPTASPTSPPPAEEIAAPFGAQGQFVITGASNVGISWETFDSSQARHFSASLSPGLDYFVLRNFAVGVDLDCSYADSRGYGADGSLVETRTTTIAGGPRVAFNIAIGRSLSLFPRVTLGFESVQREQQVVSGSTISVPGSPVGYPSTTQTGPWVGVFVPLLFHLRPNFFLGGGPTFYREFASVQGGPNVGGQQTRFGGSVIVGGSWGGAPRAATEEAQQASSSAAPHRFGDRGVMVLDSEFGASAYFTGYEGTSSSAQGGAFELSGDYFVTDRVSIGAAPFFSYSKVVGVDATNGAAVTTETNNKGLEARLGVDVPLGRGLSLYTRLGLVLSSESLNETSATAPGDNYTTAVGAVHVYAPLLVHPAAHLFAGFGPFVYWQFSDNVTFADGNSTQNRAFQVGASLVVGGWL
jgi:hypothetical protein